MKDIDIRIKGRVVMTTNIVFKVGIKNRTAVTKT